jgi:hypothetical protein
MRGVGGFGRRTVAAPEGGMSLPMKVPVRALSIRQPFAELILTGRKTAEYRTRPTRLIGERFWIYASKGRATSGEGRGKDIWSRDLAVPDAPLPPWMIELAEGPRLWKPGELPTGVIVGSAVIERCEPLHPVTPHSPRPTMFAWHLSDVRRAATLRKPARHPQPAWFVPY